MLGQQWHAGIILGSSLCDGNFFVFDFIIFKDPTSWSTPSMWGWLLKSMKSCWIKLLRNSINNPLKTGSLIARWTSSSRSNDVYLSQITNECGDSLVLGSQHSHSNLALLQIVLRQWNLPWMLPPNVWRTFLLYKGRWQCWQLVSHAMDTWLCSTQSLLSPCPPLPNIVPGDDAYPSGWEWNRCEGCRVCTISKELWISLLKGKHSIHRRASRQSRLHSSIF